MDAMQQARLRQQMDQAQREAQAGLQQKQNEQQLAQYAEAGNMATKAQQLMNQRMGTALQYTLGTPQEAFDFSLLSTPLTDEQTKFSISGFPWKWDRHPGNAIGRAIGYRPHEPTPQALAGFFEGYLPPGAGQGGPGGNDPQSIINAWNNQQGW